MSILSIIIPVYFNEGSLIPLADALAKIESKLVAIGISVQLIFVNDGSRDESLTRLLEIKKRRPETIVMNHLANRGSMAAIKTGLAKVRGDCLTYLAADLQDPPELLFEMAELWQKGRRFVIRTRSTRSDPFITRLFSWLNYRIVRLLVMRDFPPGGFDMAIMDKVFLPHLLKCGRNKNLAMFAWSLGVPAEILTYHRAERVHGKSMWTFRKKINYFIDSTVGFSVKPLRLATGFGFILAALCFSYAFIVVLGKLLGFINVPGFTALAAMLGFLQGCGFIVLGMLGEYIWRIYSEMDRHPEPIVEEIHLEGCGEP